jgi:cobalamin biosynthesis protein CobW
MKPLIPVTIVTGFLGSGKTTLLRSLIERRQTRRLALLINEFGEVSIDGVLIRDAVNGENHIRIHDFPYGLIAYGDDALFIPTMKKIAARRANVDHVLIETSGLALPTAVMELLQSPELADDFILDATLAVVDTPLLLANEFSPGNGGNKARAAVADSVARTFEQQIEFADVVVLNKIDELDENALLDAETRVRQCAPNVRFLELAYQAKLDIRLALGLRLHQPASVAHDHRYTLLAGMPGASASVLDSHAAVNGHSHSGLGRHNHGIATHKHFHEQDPGWMSFVLRSQAPQDAVRLKAALAEAAKAEPILRSKGFARMADSAEMAIVQGVRTRITVATDPAKSSPPVSELVVIGYHLSRAKVAAILSEYTATSWK